MSQDSAALLSALIEQTREVLEAVEGDRPSDEVDRLVEGQREAFSDFSRQCDTGQPLDASMQDDVDEMLRLEEKVMTSLRRECQDLAEQNRSLAGRRNQARAFHSRGQEPPRFVTRHV